MKSIQEFLSELNDLDIRLWVEGEKLRCNAPKGVMTEDIKTKLGQRKAEIINFLAGNQAYAVVSQLIPPLQKRENLPLSFAQERLWFLAQLEGESATYNMSGAFKLEGELNLVALEKSIREIVARHEVLRTKFQEIEGQLRQVIAPELQIHFPVLNLENFSDAEAWEQAINLIQAEIETPFALSHEPLLRVKLFKLAAKIHILVVTMHHIISDGWSIGVFIQEISTLYQAFCQGNDSPLAKLSIQYADFAHWQRQWLKEEILYKQLNYWQERLKEIPSLLELPIDYPRLPVQTFQGRTEKFYISSNITEKLKQLSQDSGATLFMSLLTAFSILLARYTRQEDIVIGTPIANRNRQQIEPLIGCFVNTLVLRTKLINNPSFKELLAQVQYQTLEDYAHQDVPFEKIVEYLQPERNLSHSPLFQVMFTLENVYSEQLSLSGLKITPIEIENKIAKFDFTLSLKETETGLAGRGEYNSSLFQRETILRMIESFQTLLEAIVKNPEEKVFQLPILTAREQQKLLVEWNNTATNYPANKCIHQLFEEQVEKTPDAIAVEFGGLQLTYQQLNQQANQLAHYLQNLEVRTDSLVGICLERSLEMMVGLLGILKAGGAYVAIDPSYPQERTLYMLEDARVKILLTQKSLVSRFSELSLTQIYLDTDREKFAQADSKNLITEVTPDNLAYVIYTSGSTGKPKGTLIIHRGLVNYLSWCINYYQVAAGNGAPVQSSISFDATITSMFSPLLVGSKVILLSNQEEIEALGEVLKTNQNLSLVKITPAHLEIINQLLTPAEMANVTRAFVLGGEALQGKLLELWRSYSPETRIINEYGPTETVVGCCIYEVTEQTALDREIPIGRPIANTQLFILDAYLQPVPVGVKGELYIGGAGVALGYLNRPELTAERFIVNPWQQKLGESTKLYKTGDLARYRPDGQIEYLGRSDNQVKIRGFRIELGEIEAVLTTHPDVRESVVMVREAGAENQRLVAYMTSSLLPTRLPYQVECFIKIAEQTIELTTKDISSTGVSLRGNMKQFTVGQELPLNLILPGESTPTYLRGTVVWTNSEQMGVQFQLSETEKKLLKQSFKYLLIRHSRWKTIQRTLSKNVQAYLKSKLPDYMIPSAYVLLEILPLTPNGKVDRRALPEPEESDIRRGEKMIAPRTIPERIIAGIWQELLGVEASISDNFFELGGHSLLATQVVSRLRKEFQHEFSLRHIFECPTIEQLAQKIENLKLEESALALPAIQPIARGETMPLSWAQERLWFLAQLEGNSATYNVPAAVQIQGYLDEKALEKALQEIVRRHESLRTTFKNVNGQPLQVVHPSSDLSLKLIDLKMISTWAPKVQIEKIIQQESQEAFNLEISPLLRVTLIKLTEQEQLLMLTMHHIISDGWSMGVLIRELSKIYQAYISGEVSPLEKLPIQYGDFVDWQRKWLTAELMEKQLSYWQKKLSGIPPLLELPTDKPRPASQTFQGEIETFTIDVKLAEELKTLSNNNQVTLFMLLLTAFANLLYRYSSQEDMVIGSPVANRNRQEIEPLIGFFVNTLVLRIDFSGNPTFLELLQQVQQTTLDAYAYQDLPFEKLVEHLRPERNLSYSPIFQVMFVLQNAPLETLELEGVSIKPLEITNKTAKFDLSLYLRETEAGLFGTWEYNQDLFESETISRMINNFITLLEKVVENPQQKVAHISILTETEQQKLLTEWNNTETDYPQDKCIHQLFEEQVNKTPDAVAVRFKDSQLTYRELNQKANQLAHYLYSLGVNIEDIVGICVERSLEMLIGLLAILKVGAAYVPLDPSFPQQRLTYMREDAQIKILLTQQSLAEEWSKTETEIVLLDQDWSRISQQELNNLEINVQPDNLAYVIYTSGSTGKPKGVQVTHRGVVNFLMSMAQAPGLTATDKLLAVTTISFDIAALELYLPLISGAEIVLASGEIIANGQELIKLIDECQITVMQATPATWRLLLTTEWQNSPQLKILCGGEALSRDLSAQLREKAHSLWNLYGPTETTIWSTCQRITKKQDNNQTQENAESIGRPIANTKIYILDQYLQPVPIGASGELHIGGIGVARGYLNRPDLTAEKFIPNPFQAGTRLYKTGDLARYRPDGKIDYLGRIDNQVKLRGFRIELGEIEAAIIAHPDVQEAVVIIREDVKADKRLVAYLKANLLPERFPYQVNCLLKTEHHTYELTTEDFGATGISLRGDLSQLISGQLLQVNLSLPGAQELTSRWLTGKVISNQERNISLQWQLSASEKALLQKSFTYLLRTEGWWEVTQRMLGQTLKKHLKSKLPEYMIPSAYVLLDSFPLTPNGKIDRRALPAPNQSSVRGEEKFVAPRTDIEKKLAAIWQEVLGVEASVFDNFFDLGGHSLLATQVMSRIRQLLQIELPLRILFEVPSIAQLSEYIASVNEKEQLILPPITPIPRTGELPLSWSQQRLWFIDQLEGDSVNYNIYLGVSLNGNLDHHSLEKAIQTISKRHESLRTNFTTINGQPVQIIAQESAVRLRVENLTELASEAQKIKINNLVEQEAKTVFNLAKDCLIRVTLLQLSDNENILLIIMHHIISDGWSMGIFLRELSQLYNSYHLGVPASLSDLSIQYVDFAAWQRKWLASAVLDQQIAYWKKQLANIPPLLELPTDYPRPPRQSYRGGSQSLSISAELSQQLQHLSQKFGVTLFMTLLSALAVLLARYSRQEDLVIGTPIANRNRAEIEPLIGFFVNTLALRVDLSENPSFQNLLAQVRTTTLEAYAHQDLPFERLVEAINPERNLSHSPLFQVMFVLQNAPLEPVELPGLTITPIDFASVSAKFDLTIVLTETDSGLTGTWEYSTDLFAPETIERMIGHFQALITGIVHHPEQLVCNLPLIPEPEQHQLLWAWNNTQANYPQNQCIHQLFATQVEQNPDAIAVVFADQSLTYQELNQRANQLAHYLEKLGVKPESLVGICVERSLEMIVGILGILKAGGAYLPLDPSYPQERLAYMMEDAQVQILLTQEKLTSHLPQTTVNPVLLDQHWQRIAQESPQSLDIVVKPNNLAYVIYTSGSTGKPKGVMLEHQGLCNLAQAQIELFKVCPSSRVLQFASFSFDASVSEVFMALVSGASLYLGTSESLQLGENLNQLLRRYQITHLTLPPSALTVMSPEDLPDLETIIVAGEACPVALAKKWSEKKNLFNGYGPTESTVCATVGEYLPATNQLPIGRPIANTQIYLLDSYQQPVPIGVSGELHIGGIGLARGYLNRPELTAEKFIPHPFIPNQRLYKTGDLARYLPDGNIEYLGRIDHQVKLRGFRIELGEIETLLSAHTQIRTVAVIVREDVPNNRRLVAYIVPQVQPIQDEAKISLIEQLKAYLGSQLPNYMIPSAFVILEDLPLTPNGKVNRRALPSTESILYAKKENFIEPRTEQEKTLAAIWAQVLGLEKVSINDNFFELGGDSIMSIQVVSRANQAGLKLTPQQLFEHQNIAALSTVVSTIIKEQTEQELITGSVPLTPIQHWFFEQNLPESHHWNQAVILEVAANIQADKLELALEKIINHHDVLRSRFNRNQSIWSQEIIAQVDKFTLQVIDLSGQSYRQQVIAIETLANQLQASLNLSEGLLMRVALFKLGTEQTGRLLIIIHHLVIDGVSWRILLEDLTNVYQQLQVGKTIDLPAKTTAYKTWAEKLINYAQTEKITTELDYWLKIAQTEVKPLPIDYTWQENNNLVAFSEEVTVSLDEAKTQALLQEIPSVYKTQINDILLTALGESLAQWTGQNSLLIELEGHGREELFENVDLSRTVGWFTSVFPVMLTVPNTQDIGAKIKQIKEQLRQIPQRGIGYGILRYLSQNQDIINRMKQVPKPQIGFNYLGQFETGGIGDLLIKFAQESSGLNLSPQGKTTNLLSINSLISQGKLTLTWSYSNKIYQRTTIEQLAQGYIKVLEQLIKHCQDTESGGYTPSDFVAAKLNQKQLDKLMSKIKGIQKPQQQN